jgi:hypothetical protein
MEWLKDFISKVKAMISRIAGRNRKEIAALQDNLEVVQEMYNLFDKGMKAAKEGYENRKAAKVTNHAKPIGEINRSIKQSSEHGNIAVLETQLVVPKEGEKINAAIKRFFNDNLKNRKVEVIETSDKVIMDQINKYLYPGKRIENAKIKKDAVSILADMIAVGTSKRHKPDLLIDEGQKNMPA